MDSINALINKLNDNAIDEVYWLGSANRESITTLKDALSIDLPSDFMSFLSITGGGGVVGEEMSGIVNNDVFIESGGSIYYDTMNCRKDFELPLHLCVIYFKDDDVCWCIDCSDYKYGSVINYDLFSKKITGILHPSFMSFFNEYVELRV